MILKKRVHSESRHNEKCEMRLCLCVCSTFVHITNAWGSYSGGERPPELGEGWEVLSCDTEGAHWAESGGGPSTVATTVAPVFVSQGDSGGLRKQCFLRLIRVTKIHPEENTIVIMPMYGKL